MSKHALLNWIEISRSALEKNINSLAALAPGRIMSVCVKANAYGHGLAQIVHIVRDNPKCNTPTVHSLDEAIVCRAAGWTRNIMVLGPLPDDRADAVIEYDLEPVISTKPFLIKLGKLGDKFDKAIKDTPQTRNRYRPSGRHDKELPAYAEIYHRFASLKKPYGASTHFANIEDTTNHEYAEFQLGNFVRMIKLMRSLKIAPAVRHTASSAATILFAKTHFELVRPGISVYGHWPSKQTYLSYRLSGGENDLFQPILSWRSRITQLKQLPADAFIGYGCTYRTTAPTRLAIVPVGYYEGYARALSNQAYVLIRGKRAPVRGRICMNLMMVDVTDIKGSETSG